MVEQYEKLSDIGNGSFGKVCRIRRKCDGSILVWKEMNYGKMGDKEKQQLVSEVNILRELNHPNIVKYYDRIIDKANAKIYIIMEYCEGGDLQQIIRNSRKSQDSIAEDVIWRILTQITQGLYQCHRRQEVHRQSTGQSLSTDSSGPQKILHRDLKPGNIFLDSNSNVKLGDFGLARIMNQESQFAHTHVGTPYYMSPEQINDSKYNEKSDIWALGCIIYELAALHPPFQAQNHLSLAMKIKAGKFERVPNRYSEELHRVVCWMLNQNPSDRPSVDDLMNMPQINMKIREYNLREALTLLKKKEEELRSKEERLNEKETALKDKEQQLIEKETLLNGLLKSQDLSNKNPDLLRSIQRMASTRIGENSLLTSERISIGSKLKESKYSAGSISTNGYESSSNSRGQKTTGRSSRQHMKTDYELRTLEETKQYDDVTQEDSVPVVKAPLQLTDNEYCRNIQFYPSDNINTQRTYETLPDYIEDENSFRQTVFNPDKGTKQHSSNNQDVHNMKMLTKLKKDSEKAFRTFDARTIKTSARGNSSRPPQATSSLENGGRPQSGINNQPSREVTLRKPINTSQTRLSHAPSMETLLYKKLNDSTTKIIQKCNSRVSVGTNSSFTRQESADKSSYLGSNLSFERQKNSTYNFQSVTSELQRQLEMMQNATMKFDKINPIANKQVKKCPSSTKSRPPLTDRTNIFNQKQFAQNMMKNNYMQAEQSNQTNFYSKVSQKQNLHLLQN